MRKGKGWNSEKRLKVSVSSHGSSPSCTDHGPGDPENASSRGEVRISPLLNGDSIHCSSLLSVLWGRVRHYFEDWKLLYNCSIIVCV